MTALPPPAPIPGLPALAGLCSLRQATAPGLSVDATVTRLKRLHAVARAAHRVLVSRITDEPQYELKMLYSHHAWLLAELVTAIRGRVGEMREPPLGLEDPPPPALQLALDEIAASPDGTHLCAGLYTVLLPALDDACAALHADAHPLADAPTRHLLRHARLDLADMPHRRTAGRAGARRSGRALDQLARGRAHGARRRGRSRRHGRRTRRHARRHASPRRHGPTIPCRDATRASPIRTTWRSTPRRSSTTRRSRPSPSC